MTNAVGSTNSVAEFNWLSARKGAETTGTVAAAKDTEVTGSVAKVNNADESKKLFNFDNKPQQTIADAVVNGGFAGGRMDIAA